MTNLEQLEQWISGISVHNENNECVPDFSCCYPSLEIDTETKKLFLLAYTDDYRWAVNCLLCEFLGNLIQELEGQQNEFK